MKPVSNRQLAHAFAVASSYLPPTRRGRNEFICNCLDSASDDRKISYRVAEAARGVIESRLSGCRTFMAWLHIHGGVPEHDVWNDRRNNEGRKAQAARRAWLNSLVAEFGGAVP